MEKILDKAPKPEDENWRARASAAVAVADQFRPSSKLEDAPMPVKKSKRKSGVIAGAWDKARMLDMLAHGMII